MTVDVDVSMFGTRVTIGTRGVPIRMSTARGALSAAALTASRPLRATLYGEPTARHGALLRRVPQDPSDYIAGIGRLFGDTLAPTCRVSRCPARVGMTHMGGPSQGEYDAPPSASSTAPA